MEYSVLGRSCRPFRVREIRLVAVAALLVLSAVVPGCNRQTPAQVIPATEIDPKWSDHAQGLPFFVGYDEGLEAARANDRPVMFYVTFPECSWCRKLSTESFNDPQVRSLLEKFVLVIVDLHAEPQAAEALGSDGAAPYIVFQTADGKKLAVSADYKPVADFKAVVEHALSRLDS